MPSEAPVIARVNLDDLGDDRVILRRKPLTWVATIVVIVLAIAVLQSIVTNIRFEWEVVFQYFTSESVLRGLWRTIELTVLAMSIGIALGVILALMRLSDSPVLKVTSNAYIWFFRGTPLLVQLILLYNISALYPRLIIGVPFGPELFSGDMNAIVTPYLVALLALALNESAYMAEIVRGGILSVDQGQVEAARALGMRKSRVMRRIVIPQAMRFIIPPTGNQVLSLLKASSLVSVIALPELLYSVQVIYTRTFQTIPLLLVATIWYLIVTSILMVAQSVLERYYSRGTSLGASVQNGSSFTRLTGIPFPSLKTRSARAPDRNKP